MTIITIVCPDCGKAFDADLERGGCRCPFCDRRRRCASDGFADPDPHGIRDEEEDEE